MLLLLLCDRAKTVQSHIMFLNSSYCAMLATWWVPVATLLILPGLFTIGGYITLRLQVAHYLSTVIRSRHPCCPITKKLQSDHDLFVHHKRANPYRKKQQDKPMKSWQKCEKIRQGKIMIQLFIWVLPGVKSKLWSLCYTILFNCNDPWMTSSLNPFPNIVYTLPSVLVLLTLGRRLSVFILLLLIWFVVT